LARGFTALDFGDDFRSMDQRSCDIAGMIELPTGDGDVAWFENFLRLAERSPSP